MSTKKDEWEKEFWQMLAANQFVKSTNSLTDEVKEYPPAIVDMEATVSINGEFDKYAIDEWFTTLRKEQEEAYTKGYNAGLADGTGKPLLAIEQMREEAVARERLRLARVVIDASMIDEDEINEADFDDVSKTDAFMIGIEHVHKAFREALAPQNTKTDTTNSDRRDEDQHREQCEGRY